MVAIDISYSQSTNIDFVALRASGVDTVIMKAGGSNTGSQYVDSKYRWFEPRARAAGMRIGHYWFNGFGDPISDADFFVNNLYDFRAGDLLALDCESEGSMPYWTPAKANPFRDRVRQRTNTICDVYMSSSVTKAQNWSSTAAGSGLWVAQYGTNSGAPQGSPNISYWSTYKLWQYTSNATFGGYAGRLDANIVNETQWASGSSTPIKPITDNEEDMKIISVPNGTIALVGPTYGVKYTSTAGGQGFSIGANSKAYGVVSGLTEDEVATLVNEANARGALLKPVISDAQIASLATQIASQLDVTNLTTQQIQDACTAAITPVVNGVVVNPAQNNADQIAEIKNFKYGV